MTWVLIKEYAEKSWVWLKTNWQVPFLVVWSVVVYLLSRRNTDALLEVIKTKDQSHKREVEALQKSHKDEVLKLKGLQVEYVKTIKELEENFKQQEKELSEKQVEDVKQIVIKSKGDPEEIKRKIEDEFGIKFKQ